MDIRIASDIEELHRYVEEEVTDEVEEEIGKGDGEMDSLTLVEFLESVEDPSPHRKKGGSDFLIDLILRKGNIDKREKKDKNNGRKSTEKVKL